MELPEAVGVAHVVDKRSRLVRPEQQHEPQRHKLKEPRPIALTHVGGSGCKVRQPQRRAVDFFRRAGAATARRRQRGRRQRGRRQGAITLAGGDGGELRREASEEGADVARAVGESIGDEVLELTRLLYFTVD